MAQQIVVAGESLVVEFVDGANLYMYEHIAAETISDWLQAGCGVNLRTHNHGQ